MIFNIIISNKIATTEADNEPIIVCGNSDYIINFKFDDEWENYEFKTAVFTFKRNGQKKVIEKLFSGIHCPVPVLSGIDEVYVGVYAGELHTSTPAKLYCKKSALCDVSRIEDPPKDVYTQLLEMLQNYFPFNAAVEAKNAAESANQAAATLNDYINNNLPANVYALAAGTVLWTNDAPTKAFEAQSIEIDCTEYKRFKIVFKHAQNNNYYSVAEVLHKDFIYHHTCTSYSGQVETLYRQFIFTDTGVEFYDTKNSDISETQVANSNLIPYEIVGYKY